jgi:beta-lactam-binding protein with PASTA domain
MRTALRIIWMSLVMLIVALVSALVAMQLAVHGREVRVPDLRSKTPAEARRIAEDNGLTADVQREYYSAVVPEGKVLSQTPAPGTIVRRGWEIRVALSLGRQRVAIPNIKGESERAAAISITEHGLSLGATATVQLPDTAAGQVIAQDPAPNTTDASAPKVSLLVAQDPAPQTFVMPSFLGQPLGSAEISLKNAGFSIGKVTVQPAPVPISAPSPTAASPPAAGNSASTPNPAASLAAAPSNAPAAPSPASVIVSQEPAPGARVAEGIAINFVVR